MPFRDGTGPNGMGSRTGRGLGICTGVNAPGFGQGFDAGYGRGNGMRARNGYGNGFGLGFRGGRGGRNRGGRWWRQSPGYAAGITAPRETLAERAASLEAELAEVRRHMKTNKQENAG